MWRLLVPLAIVVLAACGADTAPAAPVQGRLPAPLAELTLVEDHPQISPAAFPHGLHTDAARMGEEVACARCHHELDDDPDTIPQRCTECHGFAYLAPEVDDAVPHEHAPAPDL